MTGSLAQTIQGEAGSDPAAQFAVATTIYNRMQAGNFPGGTNPTAIVNAPQQYVGYAGTPNSSAQAFAAAIENGTLDHFGTVGNAVNFQSGSTAAANGLTAGANVGGNWFSNTFGPPTAGFQAPVFGGAGGVLNGALGGAVAAVTGSAAAGQSVAGTGQQVSVGLQASTQNSIEQWITQVAKGVWSGVWDSLSSSLLSIQNWFVRAFVIVVGIVILAIALIKLSGHNVTDIVVDVAKTAAVAA